MELQCEGDEITVFANLLCGCRVATVSLRLVPLAISISQGIREVWSWCVHERHSHMPASKMRRLRLKAAHVCGHAG